VFINGLFSLLSGSHESGKLSTLAFHKVPNYAEPLVPNELRLDHFEQILAFLTRHFRVLPLSEAVSLLARGMLPPRSVAITFDDGYGDWLQGVSALLLKYQAHATFFIVTEQLSGLPLWNERIVAAVRAAPSTGARLPRGFEHLSDLAALPNRRRLVSALINRLTHCHLETRLATIADLESQAVIPLDIAPPFSATEVLELHRQGFEIGAHTVRHPILNNCSQKDARDEIGGSREELEAVVRSPVTLFAYPNGRPHLDFSPDHVRLVRECGYSAAVTTAWGVATRNTDAFMLPRFTPWGRVPLRIGLQLARNMLTARRGPDWWGWMPPQPSSAPRPYRIMTVENGAGFGGAVVALETLLQRMSPNDAQVHVLSNYAVGKFESIPVVCEHKVIPDRRFNFSALARRLRLNGASDSAWHRVALFVLGRLDDLVNRLPYLVALLREVRRIRPNVIHGNNTPLSNREAIVAAFIMRVPYIQHVRGPIESSGGVRWLLARPLAFIAVSKWIERSLVERGIESSRISQLYDALQPAAAGAPAESRPYFRAELGIPADAQVITMVGMLLEWKGQQLFLDAIARLVHRFPNTYFLLIGGTPHRSDAGYEGSLRRRIEVIGAGNRVLMTGIREDVFQILREVDAVVSASLEPEPLGLVMLEAMMAGKIFIGPAHGAATELIQHGRNGLLFRACDAESLTDVLESFLSAQLPAHEIAVRGREDARRNFDQPNQAEAFTALLRHVL
jgi:glycosyltransferase involved in cell wall biosynthesis/peptidoglycan/xylan/chitin deacetylase (PgdA/CDA1 family)